MRLTLEEAMEQYQISVFRAAFYITRNIDDAEEAAQETFIAYYRDQTEFESAGHVKAWLLRTAINKAKNTVRFLSLRRWEDIDSLAETLTVMPQEDSDLLKAVLGLPERCREVIHLFYYEDCPVKEIAKILGMSENTVKSQLHRGRSLLSQKLKEDWIYD